MLKRVTPTRYEKIGDYQTAMEADVANLPASTRTVFTMRDVRYDAGVPRRRLQRLQPRQGVGSCRRHDLGPRRPWRTGRRRHRAARAYGRRRACATDASRGVGRVDGRRAAGDRRRRPRRHAGLHRRAHALRRAARLGPDRVAVVVARRHHRARRQLRLHARAGAAGRRRLAGADAVAASRACRPTALGAGLRWQGGELRRLLARARRPHRRQRRRLRRALGGAPLRHGRRRVASAPRAPTRSRRCRTLVRAAMREGALGFSSSQLDIHVAHDGREVPSNHAAPEELIALCAVLAEFGHGAHRVHPAQLRRGLRRRRPRAASAPCTAASGPADRAQHADAAAGRARRLARAASSSRARRLPRRAAHPSDVRDQQARRALRARLDVPLRRDAELPRRRSRCRPPSARARAARSGGARAHAARAGRPDRARVRRSSGRSSWSRRCATPRTRAGSGRTVTELAEERGADPLDCFLDLSLAEDLETQFVIEMPPERDVRADHRRR